MSVPTAHAMRIRLSAYFGCTDPSISVPQPVSGPPEHLVVFEVAIDGPPKYPGVQGLEDRFVQQRIDAVAVGLWDKSEHLVHGIEIKVGRADLLAELRKPAKAEAGMRACDRWWLALGSATLLKPDDELPAGWGVLVPHGRGLKVARKADPMPGVRDTAFTAALMQAELRSSTYRRSIGWWAGYQRGVADGRRVPEDRAKRDQMVMAAYSPYELRQLAEQIEAERALSASSGT